MGRASFPYRARRRRRNQIKGNLPLVFLFMGYSPPSPSSPSRAASKKKGKRKVRTTKNHQNRHLCRVEEFLDCFRPFHYGVTNQSKKHWSPLTCSLRWSQTVCSAANSPSSPSKTAKSTQNGLKSGHFWPTNGPHWLRIGGGKIMERQKTYKRATFYIALGG